MASYTGTRAVNKTLTSTTVDTVTMVGSAGSTYVKNRGPALIWVTVGASASAVPADPTVAGDNCFPIAPTDPPLKLNVGGSGAVVKILGSGDAYSVFRAA